MQPQSLKSSDHLFCSRTACRRLISYETSFDPKEGLKLGSLAGQGLLNAFLDHPGKL